MTIQKCRLAVLETNAVALSCNDSGERVPPEEFLLIKSGKNLYTRNGFEGEFFLTDDDASSVVAEFNARGRDLVIDYEHQSLSGEKAPAAGWIDRLEKTVDGIVAHVKYWTEEAKKLISSGEYRYFSPTLYFSRSGKNVSSVHSVALTNHPAMHNVPALAAGDDDGSAVNDDACLRHGDGAEEKAPEKAVTPFDDVVSLLGLAEDVSGDEVKSIVAENGKKAKALDDFLLKNGFSTLSDAEERISTGVSAQEVEELKDELKKLKASELVRKASSEGKIAFAAKDWAKDFAGKDPEAFAVWAEAAPRIVPCNEGFEECVKPIDADGAGSLTTSEMKIFRMLGLDKKKIRKND